MIVVHSRDDEEVGMAHEVKSLKNQLQFSQTTMGQYWLGKTKPKQAFRLTRNAFKKLQRNSEQLKLLYPYHAFFVLVLSTVGI